MAFSQNVIVLELQSGIFPTVPGINEVFPTKSIQSLCLKSAEWVARAEAPMAAAGGRMDNKGANSFKELVCSVQSNTPGNTPTPELTEAHLNPELWSSFLKSLFSKGTWNPNLNMEASYWIVTVAK